MRFQTDRSVIPLTAVGNSTGLQHLMRLPLQTGFAWFYLPSTTRYVTPIKKRRERDPFAVEVKCLRRRDCKAAAALGKLAHGALIL